MESNEILRQSIDIELPFRDENGQAGVKHVHIDFVSQRIDRMYAEYALKVETAKKLYERMASLLDEAGRAAYADLNIDKYLNEGLSKGKAGKRAKEEKIRTLAEIMKERSDIEQKIREIGTDDFFNARFKLIEKIIQKNGIDDPDLLDKDWWDDCVDSFDMVNFINKACTKDSALIQGKKKEQAAM